MPAIQPSNVAAPGRGRGRRVAPSLSEINVVPLVDVMLVLLIIFMVTAPMIQRGIDVTLPVATRASAVMSERVFVTVPATYATNHILYIDDEAVPADVLTERIRQRLQTASHKDIYFRGDSSVTLGDVIDVVNRLKAAGVENLNFLTRLPGER